VPEKLKVLVTGATGRIGRALMEELDAEFALTGTSRSPRDDRRFIQLDYTDTAAVRAAFAGQDAVVHMHAKAAHDGESLAEYLQPNIVDVHTTYEAARLAGVRRVVFASSNHATGWTEVAGERAGADTPARPDGLYGAAKAWGEALGSYYADRFGLEVVCLRIGSYNYRHRPPDFAMGPRILSTWLSDDDLVQLVQKAVTAPGVGYGIYYGISNNSRGYWDLTNAAIELGYQPRDNAEDYAEEVLARGGVYRIWGAETWHTAGKS
jgi:uronate dehydrogenase